MTHTLIATHTLDTCIHMCPPPPPTNSTLDNPTQQTHMVGRREGVTHLPLGVTLYALLNSLLKSTNSKKQKHTCKKVMDTFPNLKHHKQSSPTTQITMWKGGGGDSLTLRGCLCGACGRPLTPPSHLTSYVVCCVYAKLCVCAVGGGVCVCMRQVC